MEAATTKIRVCFISPKAYPIFNPDVQSVFGGAEVDLYMIATELAKDETFNVSFIVADYGQPDEEQRENVRILKSLDFKQNPLTGAIRIWNAMKRADADWYMLETASPGVPLGLLFARLHRRKMLYRTAHEKECNGDYLARHFFLGKLFKASIRRVDALVTQNRCDQENLLKNMNVSSTVIPNGHPIPCLENVSKKTILWVGRSVDFKHPERFLALAKAFPDEHFTMICQRATGDRHYDDLKASAAGIQNLEFIERVPFHEIDRYFENAKVFVNTSDSEGFPNTFIQACKASTAILSFGFNPDNFLDVHRCGIACGFTGERMAEHLKAMLEDGRYIQLGRNGRDYAAAVHNIVTVAAQYKDIFKG